MEIRCADRPEVYGIDVDRLVGGAQVLVRRRVLDELDRRRIDRHALRATKFTLCFVEVASSPGGRATASRSAAAGGSATSAHGLLGGSGGSDAAGAAAAWLAARFAVRRWRAFSVAGLAIQGVEGLLTGAPVWLVLCSDVPVRGLRRSSSSVRSAPGGESAMDFGCTLMFMQSNSNSNSPESP